MKASLQNSSGHGVVKSECKLSSSTFYFDNYLNGVYYIGNSATIRNFIDNSDAYKGVLVNGQGWVISANRGRNGSFTHL